MISSNRLDLYELCVQDPEREALFLCAVHAGAPLTLAEDFSGPASICRAWLRVDDGYYAIATDVDPEPLEHCVRTLAETLGPGAVERLTVNVADVLEAKGEADIIAALNFAACELHTRERLVTYLRHALFRLNAGGVLVLDTYGGANAYTPGVVECEVHTDAGTVLYEWEQVDANPLTGRVVNAIHFTLPDGTRLEQAFSYDWRLWSVTELRDAMREAGFRSTEVHHAMGGAVTDEGEVVATPSSTDDAPDDHGWPDGLEESYVCFVVGRV